MSRPRHYGRVVDRSLTEVGRGRSFSFNLAEELEALELLEEWKSGSGRKTLVRYPDFRIDLVVLRGGTCIGRHSTPGRISVQCVTGRIRMRTEGGDFELGESEVLVLDHNVAHDVEAVEDSAFLLTVSLPHEAVPAIFNTGRWALPSAHATSDTPAA